MQATNCVYYAKIFGFRSLKIMIIDGEDIEVIAVAKNSELSA